MNEPDKTIKEPSMSFCEFQSFAVGIIRDDAGNTWIAIKQRHPSSPNHMNMLTIHPYQVPGLQACLDRAYAETFAAASKPKATRDELMHRKPLEDEDLFQ